MSLKAFFRLAALVFQGALGRPLPKVAKVPDWEEENHEFQGIFCSVIRRKFYGNLQNGSHGKENIFSGSMKCEGCTAHGSSTSSSKHHSYTRNYIIFLRPLSIGGICEKCHEIVKISGESQTIKENSEALLQRTRHFPPFTPPRQSTPTPKQFQPRIVSLATLNTTQRKNPKKKEERKNEMKIEK